MNDENNNADNNEINKAPPVSDNSSNTNASADELKVPIKNNAVAFVVVGVVVVIILTVLLGYFYGKKPDTPILLGVDKDGVPILNLNKKQVIEKVTSGKPLDEPEARAVFRWATENPDKAARLSPEEKANIIRVLNE